MILPGATLGVMGGGQLGRMFVIAAKTLGYRVAVLDPTVDCPAAQVADIHIQTAYDDPAGLAQMADVCAAVTIEFENIPAQSLHYLQQHCIVHPSPEAVELTRDRIREKSYLAEQGVATAPFAAILEPADLAPALQRIGMPALLKTATSGYDGKGQVAITDPAEAEAAFNELGSVPCVLETRVALALELSVVLARDESGVCSPYPVAENQHVNGILDTSIVPARIDTALAQQAEAMATRVADGLGYVGTLAVEFFVTRDGELLVNEIAPRPHNSGHYTLDACITDQFEQQVRMLCGLKAGSTSLLRPVVMVNLLGDIWPEQGEPAWQQVLDEPQTKLHLYGKHEARPGRKMGHFSTLAGDSETALAIARKLFAQLQGK